jgi:hypothetical protein
MVLLTNFRQPSDVNFTEFKIVQFILV